MERKLLERIITAHENLKLSFKHRFFLSSPFFIVFRTDKHVKKRDFTFHKKRPIKCELSNKINNFKLFYRQMI